ncbi:protein kinase domain-containing protein [Allocoleopsis franciscana]|uniref:non-specific serine/threonine protein kinase n=1 Tax=Allocoleopsis franciscana PCC 7113 TaxID=1173027 RepID=K9WMV1_9CYAN|nr:protein kinase [Allocoleopsis franciscana]AFZ21740.1 serine/threonine protein kinase [Allocoleopsis franciscana PCC 7113]
MNTETNQPVLGKFLNGRYKIVQVLSMGDFGHTYVAEDAWLSGTPQCVVKFFQPQGHHPKRGEICKRRFTSDAEALRKVGTHDQLPQFLDAFEDEHGFYLVRELIVGESLSVELPLDLYDNKRWSEVQCIKLLEDVLGLLEFVHRQGIIHGDIKPSNLIRRFSDGKLVLIDFGIAHSIPQSPVQPQIVAVHPAIAPVAIPPLGYIPAEQFSGQLCPSSDLYALGMIAIQALTGLDPLQLPINPSNGQIHWQKQAAVSDALACVLNSMVRYDFKSRYQSATDARTILKTLVIENPKTQELSDSSGSESVSGLAETDDLALCFHSVSRLPQSHVSPSSLKPQQPGDEQAKEKDKASNISQRWEYAREIAIACCPKLPPIMTGIGAGLATSNALAISFGLYSLLNTAPSNPALDLLERATQEYQAGNFEEALTLAKSIPTDSSVYQESVVTVQEWRSQWNKAATQFKVVEQALEEGRWRDVLEEARKAPDNAYWQYKLELLVEQAKPEVEAQAQHLLKQAYQLAAQKDFTGAITLIKQIPPETDTGSKIQPKLKEYTQKQQIKAERLLQQAYQQASERNFKSALNYLAQIPEETPSYETAQAKMVEYSRKQNFQEEVERQVRLTAKFPKLEMKLTKLAQSSKSSKGSSRLNPGNQLKEVAPKPALTKPVRR